MSLVHLFVHGRGQGHATRCLSVGRALEDAGFEVRMSAGADALAVLKDTFETRAVESLPPTVAPAVMGFARRVRAALVELRHQRPAVVVSDGDLPGAVAARSLGIPVVAIGHGLTFLACRPPMFVDRAAWRREAAKAWVASAPARILVAVNFTPLVVRRDDAVLVRPSASLPPRATVVPGKVVCYFRDEPVVAALELLLELGKTVSSYGRVDPKLDGVQHRPRDRDAFLRDLVEAEGVVASAGSQLISECVELGARFFGLHAEDDDEQGLNVAMLRAAGLGDGDVATRFDPARLAGALDRPCAVQQWDAPTVVEATLAQCQRLTT